MCAYIYVSSKYDAISATSTKDNISGIYSNCIFISSNSYFLFPVFFFFFSYQFSFYVRSYFIISFCCFLPIVHINSYKFNVTYLIITVSLSFSLSVCVRVCVQTSSYFLNIHYTNINNIMFNII